VGIDMAEGLQHCNMAPRSTAERSALRWPDLFTSVAGARLSSRAPAASVSAAHARNAAYLTSARIDTAAPATGLRYEVSQHASISCMNLGRTHFVEKGVENVSVHTKYTRCDLKLPIKAQAHQTQSFYSSCGVLCCKKSCC